jgi:hypothetical protein
MPAATIKDRVTQSHPLHGSRHIQPTRMSKNDRRLRQNSTQSVGGRWLTHRLPSGLSARIVTEASLASGLGLAAAVEKGERVSNYGAEAIAANRFGEYDP